MGNMKLGNGIDEKTLNKLFYKYISSHINKNNKPPIAIWDYDINKLDIGEFTYKKIEMDFLTMRKLQDGTLDVDVDIIIINDFCNIPNIVSEKLISNISNNKFNCLFLFFDNKNNIDKVSFDVLNQMVHFAVRKNE